MTTKARHIRGVRFRVLTDGQCEQIVNAAFEVLERIGSRFHEPAAVQILKNAGCTVSDDILVKFPQMMVQQALDSVPERFTLHHRTGGAAMEIEPGRVYFGPGPTCPYFVDPDTGARRLFVKNDAALAARVCDELPGIDYVMSLGNISDVPQETADVHEFDAMVRETTKPIMSWSFTRKSLERIHRMCAAVKGSEDAFTREPFMIFYAEPSSPLKHTGEALRKLMYCAEHRIPLVYAPAPLAGATGPATMAGMLVQCLAECLGGVVLSQLIREGTPMVAGGVVSILDMRTTILAYGAPELSLLSAGATEVLRHLGLPMFSTAGCTDSKCLDQQAAIEATQSILFAALSGANFVHDIGFTESAMTGSLDQLVMCDDIISMARFMTRGIRVDKEALAVDAIAEAFDNSNFLALSHTVDNFRKEFCFPNLIDRHRYDEWAADGKKTMGDRVRERVRAVIKEHRGVPLDRSVTESLDRIVRE